MKLAKHLAAITVITAFATLSNARAADAPTVDSVLNKYVAASGGKAAIEKVKSRKLSIRIEGDNIAASDGEIYAKFPNKQHSHIELAGIGAMLEGFDGTEAWAKSPWEGLRIKKGDELAKTKRDAELHRELKMKTLYPDLAYKGTEKIGGEEANILESKPTPSSKERFAFSAKTGLLLRQESELEGAQGKVTLTVQVLEHKDYDGAKFPSQVKMNFSTGDQSFQFTMKVLDVKVNIPVDDSKFKKPSE